MSDKDGEKEKAALVLRRALDCLTILFGTVRADDLLPFIHEWEARLDRGDKINPEELSSKATLGEAKLSSHRDHVTSAQEVWVNSLFGHARALAHAAASFLWIYDRLVMKEGFTTHTGRTNPQIVGRSCPICSSVWVRRIDAEHAAAQVWAHLYIRPWIASGLCRQAVDEAVRCNLCSLCVGAVEYVLSHDGIQVVEDAQGPCPACGAEKINYPRLTLPWDRLSAAVERNLNKSRVQ